MTNNMPAPLPDLEPLSQEDRENYYADIGSLLESGEITEEQAADLIFGPDVSIIWYL